MIETIQDWNTRLEYCGCCQMPVCPAPLLEGECQTYTASTTGFIPEPVPEGDFDLALWQLALSKIFTVSDAISNHLSDTTPPVTREMHEEGAYSYATIDSVDKRFTETEDICGDDEYVGFTRICTVTGSYSFSDITLVNGQMFSGQEATKTTRNLGGMPIPDTLPEELYDHCAFETTYTSRSYDRIEDEWQEITFIQIGETAQLFGTAATRDEVTTFADIITWNAWLAEAIGRANAYHVGAGVDCWSPSCASSRLNVFEPSAYSSNVFARGRIESTKFRYRFRIPSAHTGSKFTITYDVAEFPEDEDVDPFFVSEDNVVEWTGAGDQNDPEGDSWLAGDWIEIDPPEVSGERRIVNIRYTCYSGAKFGVKPQVMGEAFEPPAP